MTDTVYPNGITLSANATDGSTNAVGVFLTVDSDVTVDGIYVKSPGAQGPTSVSIWRYTSSTVAVEDVHIAQNTPTVNNTGLTDGDNFIEIDGGYEFLASNTNGYVVSFSREAPVSGGYHDLQYYHTAFPSSPDEQSVFNFIEGRYVGSSGHGTLPDSDHTSTNFYGVGIYLDETAVLTVTATTPQTATTGTAKTLTATPHDAAGTVDYAWTQTSGATQEMSGDDTASMTFTPSADGTYVFRCTGDDGTTTAHVDVTVTASTTGGGGGGGLTPVSDIVVSFTKKSGEVVGLGGNLDPHVFAPESFGAKRDGETDDTVAIQAAIDAAFAYAISSGDNWGVIEFEAGTYLVSGDLVQGGETLGNAQLTIPVQPDTESKINLQFRGKGDPTLFNHWLQQESQYSGTVIKSTLTGLSEDETWGLPFILGGPTVYTQPVGGATRFSNELIGLDGILFKAPYNPTIGAIDLHLIAEVDAGKVGVVVDAYVGGTPNLATLPTNGAIGVWWPDMQNNARSQVDAVLVEGFYTGQVVSDHFNAQMFGSVYNRTGLAFGAGGQAHGISILYAVIEATATFIKATGGSEAPIFIGMLSGEGLQVTVSGSDVWPTLLDDPDNIMIGEINVADMYRSFDSQPLTVNGGKNVKITDLRAPRGSVTAPSFPPSAVALQNPFWRDAVVVITGGTVTKIEVDGVDQDVTAGPISVPSGLEIKVTYSGSPSWAWLLS